MPLTLAWASGQALISISQLEFQHDRKTAFSKTPILILQQTLPVPGNYKLTSALTVLNVNKPHSDDLDACNTRPSLIHLFTTHSCVGYCLICTSFGQFYNFLIGCVLHARYHEMARDGNGTKHVSEPLVVTLYLLCLDNLAPT